MQIQFELQELPQLVLVAIRRYEIDRDDRLNIGVQLIQRTQHEFAKLLGKVLGDGVYEYTPLGSLFGGLLGGRHGLFLAPNIQKAVKLLEHLEMIVLEPVYTETKNETEKTVVFNKLRLTDEGVRIADTILHNRRIILRSRESVRDTIFVASAFGYDEIDLLYEQEFRPACEDLGLSPFRVDSTEPATTITDSILDGIRQSEYLLADLTHSRPSVYFEIGVAYGLGIPIVLTCRRDHFRGAEDQLRVHFDLEQFKISFWTYEQGAFLWPRGMHPAERLRNLHNVRVSTRKPVLHHPP